MFTVRKMEGEVYDVLFPDGSVLMEGESFTIAHEVADRLNAGGVEPGLDEIGEVVIGVRRALRLDGKCGYCGSTEPSIVGDGGWWVCPDCGGC